MKAIIGVGKCIHGHCDNPPRPGRRECSACDHRRRRYGSPQGAGTREGKAQRALRVLLTVETDRCVEWPYHTVKGYGYVNRDGRKHVGVHVVACAERHGPAPSALHEVAHSCGNRLCLNYRHLRWATRAENMADMVEHGTACRGERRPGSRLTTDDVRNIRRLASEGLAFAEIARRYSVSPGAVGDCVNRRTWAWLDQEEVA